MLFLKSSPLLGCAILLTITADIVQSKYVHLPKTQWQISQYKEVATWDEAKKHCESEGATLASPISEELLHSMKAIIAINNHTTPYFIGFKARQNTEFRSEEGILLQDVPEAFDMVEQIDPREGDCLCMDGHSIRVEPCWSRLPFICYNNGTTDAITTEVPTTTTEYSIPTLLNCGPGYHFYITGSFYKIHEDNVTWEVANSTCAVEGGHLAILYSDFETNIVNMQVSSTHPSWPFIWVGPRVMKAYGQVRSVNGDSLNNGLYQDVFETGESGCVALDYKGKLLNRSCYVTLPFICEKACRIP